MLRKQLFFFVLLFAWSSASLHAAKIEHVIIVSVDGLRPDAISASTSPVIEALKKKRSMGKSRAHHYAFDHVAFAYLDVDGKKRRGAQNYLERLL